MLFFCIGVILLLAVYALNNLLHRRSNGIHAPDGLIFSQHGEEVSRMRFGFFPSSFNGCGWIAAHNALCLLGKKPRADRIIAEFEWFGAVLGGLFGLSPLCAACFFRRRGYRTTVTLRRDKMDAAAREGTCCILYYWHGKGAHYIACRWDGSRFVGYNTGRRSTSPDDLGTSLTAMFCTEKRRARLLITLTEPTQ